MSDPNTSTSGAARWRLRISAIAWFLLGLGFLLAIPVLWDISPLVLAGVAILALVLTLPVAWLVRALFRGQREQKVGWSYLKAAIGTLFVLATLLAVPVYVLALYPAFKPLTVPRAILSDGKRTVVFQGMMHIGSEPFYKGVVYDLEKALSEGYVAYYEGVRGDPAGDEWFSRTLAGGGDLNSTYALFGGVCGLKFQGEYFTLLQADEKEHPDRHVAADVSTADMMHEYERLMQADPEFAAAMQAKQPATEADGAAGFGTTAIAWLKQGTPELQRLAGTVCQGGMAWLLGRGSEPSPMDKVILDFRNRELVKRILGDSHPSIYITYGAEHLAGILALLKSDNPAWSIQSMSWQRTMEMPDDVSGKVNGL